METRKDYWGTYSGKELEMLKADEAREKEIKEKVNKMRAWAHRQCRERGIDTRAFDSYDIISEMCNPVLWGRLTSEQKEFVAEIGGRFTDKVAELCQDKGW